IDIEDQRSEAAVAVFGVVNHLWHRSFNSQIAAVPVHAGVIGETFGVAADIEFVIRLIEVSETSDQFGLIVTLESCAGSDVEHAVGAISKFSAVTAAIYFHVVDVFGIELRTEVGSNIGIGN